LVWRCPKATPHQSGHPLLVTLVGVNSNLETCSIVSAQALHILIQRGDVCQVLELHSLDEEPVVSSAHIPNSIQQVL
jgi:hypothetical protein